MAKDSKPTNPKQQNETLYTDYQVSLGAMERVHTSLDKKEKILLSEPIDQISQEETQSKITDPTLLSAVLKQNNSVMAQMPTGKITALTKENRGKSLFMDLIFREHVLPHATSQYDAYTKLWMLSFYRKVYGSMGVLVDYVRGGGYGKNNAGPDFTLLPIRSIIPQVGRYSETDCDYIYVRSRLGKSWLESRQKADGWKNIDKVLERKADFSIELNASSYVERATEAAMVKRDEYEIVTRYEPDRWTTFHPGTKEIIRDIANPQKNDQIPVIMCHAYPLLDRFIGLGDFERGMDLHSSLGSLITLYMDGVKAGIFPNLKIDPMAVENWAEIKKHGIGPGQVWLMKSNMFDRLEKFDVKPDLSSFNSTYSFLKAAVLTITNTSDATRGVEGDLSAGKTPQALKMKAFDQGMQTMFDRMMLEKSSEKIFDRMIDLVAKRQEKPMELYLKKADLDKVAAVNPDVVEMFEVGDMGRVKIKPAEIQNVEYRYDIDQGSTVKKDEIMENETLKDLTGFVLKNVPGAAEALTTNGLVPLGAKSFDLGEAMKRITISSGITDPDKIVVDNEQQPMDEEVIDENALNMENQNVAQTVTQSLTPQPGQSFEDPAIAQVFADIEGLAQGGQV